jgi:3-deoxy-D-manno-octulosonate 8-phosphate phosphatase (KDO 8-P phosphatase)
MTTSPHDIPADIRARAARVRLAVFDVDGVLTDGKLWYGADGAETKAFHVHDGLGLKLISDNGIEVALITARDSTVLAGRARELGLRHVFQGQRDKLACLRQLCASLNIELSAVAYTGDDLPDLAPMQHVGLAIAVANAHGWMRQHTHWQTRLRGGEGAVREVCDLLLDAQGKSDAIVRKHLDT